MTDRKITFWFGAALGVGAAAVWIWGGAEAVGEAALLGIFSLIFTIGNLAHPRRLFCRHGRTESLGFRVYGLFNPRPRDKRRCLDCGEEFPAQ